MHRTHDRPPLPPNPTPIHAPPDQSANATPNGRPLLDYVAAARLLGVSARTVRTLVKTGGLAPVRIRRRVLLDPHDLERFIDSAKLGRPAGGGA